MKKRFLAVFLALALCVGLAPAAFAADQTVVHASNTEELRAALNNLQSNTLIELEGKDYNCEILLQDLENVTIQGTAGTRIVTNNGNDAEAVAVTASRCKNLVLSNLTIGYDILPGSSNVAGGILASDTSMTISNCDIFSCNGGIGATESTITMRDSIIRDGPGLSMSVNSGTYSFQNCVFSGNGYDRSLGSKSPCVSAGAWNKDTVVTFDSCTFRDNKSKVFIDDTTATKLTSKRMSYTLTNCLFEKNGWSTPVSNGSGAGSSAPAAGKTGFTDVAAGAYYEDAVQWAVEKNITTGTTATTFSPKDNCTHAQILTFLWRAAGEPASDVTLPFATTGKEYYLGAVKWAYEKGMIGADFNPSTPCNRVYAVLYIWQAFGKPAPAKASPFTDVPAHWSSAPAAAWAAEKGITTGTSATAFSPAKICNRGEIVTFLYRAYK